VERPVSESKKTYMPICLSVGSNLLLYDLLWTCCGFVAQFVIITGLLTNISTILATHDDNFDVLAACCTINVASAVAILHLQKKLHPAAKPKYVHVISCDADNYQK